MRLNANQIKILIATQIEGYSRRIAELASGIATLRSQPIEGSLELKRRLAYLEGQLADQQSKMAGLKDLQQAIQTAESFSKDA